MLLLLDSLPFIFAGGFLANVDLWSAGSPLTSFCPRGPLFAVQSDDCHGPFRASGLRLVGLD